MVAMSALHAKTGIVPARSRSTAPATRCSASPYERSSPRGVILPGSPDFSLSRRGVLGGTAAAAAAVTLPLPGLGSAALAAGAIAEDKVTVGALSVSRMGIGTWAWGNQALWGYDPSMDSELERTFDMLVGRGINLFDTADSYGTGKLNGRSEQLLGQFMQKYGDEREDIHIATKFAAYPWRVTRGQIVEACRDSQGRLGKQVDIGQLHWSASKYAPLQERALWEGLGDIYEQGLVKAVGASNYGPRQLEKLIKYLAKRDVPLASVQVQYSLLSLGPSEGGTAEICDEYGVQLIAYSPLGLGMLTGKYDENNVPEGGRGLLFKSILPRIKPLLATMKAVANERNKTLPQVAINWCICRGTIPIPGAKTLAMAEENVGALGWRLTDGEIAELESAASGGGQMIQNIFQTQ